jgi:hypothetical protein
MSFDLVNWFVPADSGDGGLIEINDAMQITVQTPKKNQPGVFFRIIAQP